MKYISGIFALNLPCSLETSGDWHTSGLNWDRLRFKESNDSLFSDYGIEDCGCVPEHSGGYKIANTLRALLDLIDEGKFSIAEGAREDFICNEAYTQEFFSKVFMLRGVKSGEDWEKIDKFMRKEYRFDWTNFLKENNAYVRYF